MNHISKVLKTLNIKKLIEPNIKKTRRIIIEETSDYSIVLFHWKKDQTLHLHDHCGKCVFQMLNGKIQELRISNNTIQNNLLTATSSGLINKGELHAMFPLVDSISIHYYSPVPKRLCPSMDHFKLL